MSITYLKLSLKLAVRDLRGGLRKFRIFAACLILGVATISGIGSISEGLSSGIKGSSRTLLGGDLSIEVSHRPLASNILGALKHNGNISKINTLRAMARLSAGGRRTLVELKAVDDVYPLVGKLNLEPNIPIEEALRVQDGKPGALIDPSLKQRLGLKIGDDIRIGNVNFVTRAEIISEPDRIIRFTTFGPRVLIHSKALEDTGLLVEGSLVKYIYKLAVRSSVPINDFVTNLKNSFPSAGWRIRLTNNAVPGFDRFNEQVTLFLTLIGFTTLLVGGLGIANSIGSFLEQKTSTIATLKCLGGDSRLIFSIYFLQTVIITSGCIFIGVVIGSLIPLIAVSVISEIISIDIAFSVFWEPICLAALYGYLVTFIFTIWPLTKTTYVQPGQLFRFQVVRKRVRPSRTFLLAIIIAVTILSAAAIFNNENHQLTMVFILGAALLFLVFAFGAHLTKTLCEKLSQYHTAEARLILSNISRPGNLTSSIILSLGLGLTLLLTVATVENNLSRRLDNDIPKIAPSYFFIDLQPHQNEQFSKLIIKTKGINRLEKTPMTRGRIIKVNGVAADQLEPDKDIAWAIRGDRGLTYSIKKPNAARIVKGRWWPENYSGPPLVSMDANVARGLDVSIGDTLTFNILGREIQATISNLRYIDWSSLQMNFVFVFAPGILETAPHSIIAAVYADNLAAEEEIHTKVTDSFPNVSAISVKDALKNAHNIMKKIGITVRTTAAFTLFSGILVLASALGTQQKNRIYDATIFKVLGMPRKQILALYLKEYAILAIVSATIATAVAMVISWAILIKMMRSDFEVSFISILGALLIGLTLTLLIGLTSTWRSLGLKSTTVLSN